MGFSALFKYLGLAMEVVTEAADALMKVEATTDPSSPGGKEITYEEKLMLMSQLDENFSNVVTEICQEVGLEVKSVKVEIEI